MPSFKAPLCPGPCPPIAGGRVSSERLLTFALLAWMGMLVLAQPGWSGSTVTGARLYKSGPIQITADGAWVWAVNRDHDSVSRLDTATDAVTHVALPAGVSHSPRGLAVLDDGSEVWVVCHDSDRVYVLDGDGVSSGSVGTVLAQIDLDWGTGPVSIALSPPGPSGSQAVALVAGLRGASVAVLDVATRAVRGVIGDLYRSPHAVAFVDDGSAWVTHLFADGEHTRMSRVAFDAPGGDDPGVARVTTELRITAVHPQNSASTAPRAAEGGYVTPRGHPGQVPGGVDGGRLWIPAHYQNIHNTIPTSDATVQSTIRKIDVSSRVFESGTNFGGNPAHPAKMILSAVDVHDPTSSGSSPVYDGPGWDVPLAGAIDVAFSADGASAFVLGEHSENLVVVPTSTPPVRPGGASDLATIDVGRRPVGVVTSPVGSLAWVLNHLSRTVSVVDLDSAAELRQVALTPGIADPLSATVLRGAEVFHTSNEGEVSGNRKVACASCHYDAEHDGRGWDFQHLPGAHGPRATPSLLSLSRTFGPPDATTGWGQLHRSGDRDEIQDFEHTFQGVSMAGTGFLGGGVQPELGPPNAGLDSDLDAMATYLLSLEPPPRSPYRSADGSLSEAGVRGATFFKGSDSARAADAGCAVCHDPSTGFVDFAFHNVGQAVRPGEQELQNRSPANHVNTATLIGLWTSAPYDGIASWAEDLMGALLDMQSRSGTATPHGRLDGLTGRQLRDLWTFLLSIDGNLSAPEVASAVDQGPPRIVRVSPASANRIDIWWNESMEASSVESTAAWQIVDLETGASVPVLSATLDPQNGDKVSLSVSSLISGCEQGLFELRPLGPFSDIAGSASGQTNNVSSDLSPIPFAVTPVMTVTLGASGYENLTVPVHDAATIPGLQTWSHGSLWLLPNGSNPNTGFVRFDWRDAFVSATGVSDASQILSSSIHLDPMLGDAQTVTARRVLQEWYDHRGTDFDSTPFDPASGRGGPTWRQSESGVRNWNTNNARSMSAGVDGSSPSHYFGGQDLGDPADAVVAPSGVHQPFELKSAGITSAYRFWFDNPSRDFGHALRVVGGSVHQLRFEALEAELGRDAPFLEVTYQLAPSCGSLFRDGFEAGTWPWSMEVTG